MTGTQNDPFERLSQMAVPQPDPAKIEALAAASARAFAAENETLRSARPSWFARLFSGTTWLVPASATLGAVVVGILVVPMAMNWNGHDPAAPEIAPAPAPSAVAETEVLPDDAVPNDSMLGRGDGVRMGAVPPPSTQDMPLDLRDDAVVETYQFDGLEIMVRSVDEQFALYLVSDGIATAFDTRVKDASEEIVLTDALIVDRQDQGDSVLFVRSGFDTAQQQWDAFIDTGSGFALSGALSNTIYDAGDRSDLLARLE